MSGNPVIAGSGVTSLRMNIRRDNVPCLTSILMISGVSFALPLVAAATGTSPSSLIGACASPGEPNDRGAFVPFVMLNVAYGWFTSI